MSIHSYLRPVNNEFLFGEALQTSTGEVSSTQVCVARELNASMQQKETKKKKQVVPEDMKREVEFYANKHGIPVARKWASDRYKSYEYKRETVRNWRNLYCAKYVNEETKSTEKIPFKGPGRPSMVPHELTAEIKMILYYLQIAGCAISKKTTIVVGNGVLQSKSPEVLLKNGGSIKLRTKWARRILKYMEWSKRKGTTGISIRIQNDYGTNWVTYGKYYLPRFFIFLMVSKGQILPFILGTR